MEFFTVVCNSLTRNGEVVPGVVLLDDFLCNAFDGYSDFLAESFVEWLDSEGWTEL